MKKKNIIAIVAIVIFVLMLIPIPTHWKNGITEYKAILYKYTKVHTPSDISFTGYDDGWELKILGIRVGGNVNVDERLKHNENSEQTTVGSILMEVKEDTRTPKGATFILKNTTEEVYVYEYYYTIEKSEDGDWKKLDAIIGWIPKENPDLYTIKSKEEKELNIDWSDVYGELESGTYRLVKSLRKSASIESRTYTLYAEFDIK